MDALTSSFPTVSVSKLIQGVTSTSEKAAEQEQSAESNQFDTILGSVLQPDQANQVNEEELFAALIKERVFTLKGEEAATQYHQFLTERNTALTTLQGYPCPEQAANEALDALAATGAITSEEATAIRSEAFAAAQLDPNVSALYDGRGGEEDPTIAVASMEEALLMARMMIDKFDSGEQEAALFTGPYNTGVQDVGGVEEVAEDEEEEEEEEIEEEEEETEEVEETEEEKEDLTGLNTSEAGALRRSSFFVYNPESNRDGRVAVTLPFKLSSRVEQLVLKDKEGNELEQGKISEDLTAASANVRKRYRFDKAGEEYPKELVVEVHLKNGKVREYEIEDSSKRTRHAGRAKKAGKNG